MQVLLEPVDEVRSPRAAQPLCRYVPSDAKPEVAATGPSRAADRVQAWACWAGASHGQPGSHFVCASLELVWESDTRGAANFVPTMHCKVVCYVRRTTRRLPTRECQERILNLMSAGRQFLKDSRLSVSVQNPQARHVTRDRHIVEVVRAWVLGFPHRPFVLGLNNKLPVTPAPWFCRFGGLWS